MKISIITICYNSDKTIEDTILSVINQDYKQLEFIIIDGQSTDSTISIISKYKHYIDKFISEPDNGLYDALNKGINLSTGEIIGILNSDDTFATNTVLSEISGFHIVNSHIDASIGNVFQINNTGHHQRFYTSKNWKPVLLKYGFMPPHPSVFIKKSVYNKIELYNNSFLIAADYELFIRLFLINNITWLHSNITTTKMLVGGISSSGIKSYVKISKEIIEALRMNSIKCFTLIIYTRFIWKIFEFRNKLVFISPFNYFKSSK